MKKINTVREYHKCLKEWKDWTYFIQPINGGPIKIGYTSQIPKDRLKELIIMMI